MFALMVGCCHATGGKIAGDGSVGVLQRYPVTRAASLIRVTNYKDVEMALRWTAAGFPEAEKSFKKLRGHADLKTLISGAD